MEYKRRKRLLGLWIRISRENGLGEGRVGFIIRVQVVGEMVLKMSYRTRGVSSSRHLLHVALLLVHV